MTDISVTRATEADIEFVIANIREADRLEVEAASGAGHGQILRNTLHLSDEVWVGKADDDIVAVFGVHVVSFATGKAIPWLISTTLIEKHSRDFLRYCRPVFKKMCAGYDFLINYVDDRNVAAKIWLKWLGFTLHEPVPYGAQLLPFRCFTMEVKNV